MRINLQQCYEFSEAFVGSDVATLVETEIIWAAICRSENCSMAVDTVIFDRDASPMFPGVCECLLRAMCECVRVSVYFLLYL